MGTTETTVESQPKPCRSVTAEEVEHFDEFGWVKLKGFVDPDVVRTLLDLARDLMGEDGDSNPPPRGTAERIGLSADDAAAEEEGEGFAYFNPQDSGGLSSPVLRPLIHEAAKSARVLQRRPTTDGRGVGVRYYTDYFIPKLPAAKETRHGGNGPTAFHQDFISHGVDRTGGLTFWLALEPYGPEAGTMSFINRSHRAGVLGNYLTLKGSGALDTFPELRDLEMSEPMTYELGDVTVHDHLTVHGAGENLMDRPRWAYMLLTQPADVCWNGAPCPNFDWTSMRPLEPFSDGVLPTIG